MEGGNNIAFLFSEMGGTSVSLPPPPQTSWLDEAGLPKTLLSTKNSEPSSLCKIEWVS